MLSTQMLLLFAVGVTLYACFFHWALIRHYAAGRWLVAWSALATVFVAARFVQMATRDPEVVVWASRAFTALGPLLTWTILRFTLELAGFPPGRWSKRGMLVWAFTFAAAVLVTPWFVTGDVIVRFDLFGKPFVAAQGGPAHALFGAGLGGALAWALTALARSRTLRGNDRLVLGASLALYAAMAGVSVLSSLGLVPLPGIAEFGPLAVTLGTSHLIATRERQLRTERSSLADRQTAALRESEERYRGLVEYAPIGVVTCDREGTVVTQNPRMREILRLGPSAPGKAPTKLLHHPQIRAHAPVEALQRVLRTGETVSVEHPYPTADGGSVVLKIVSAPRRDAQGELQGALILIEDVTERRAVESRLRQSLKLEAIGQLAVGIAHGITTPMQDVRARLAEMRAGCDALRKELGAAAHSEEGAARFAELEQLIDESCEGVERAIAIMRDMREISQGRSPTVEPVDVNALLDGVVRMAATQRRGGVEIVERYGELPSIPANAGQLRQVFLNLAMNAIQAVGERGRIEVETTSDRDRVRVRIRDDGPGIAREHRSRLFVPFFTTKPAGEGTGLGLFLSYQIVQSHGGEIRVQSEPGTGATFEVALPIAPAPRAKEAAA